MKFSLTELLHVLLGLSCYGCIAVDGYANLSVGLGVYVEESILIPGIHMRSGPRTQSMHLRCGWPSCACACMSIPDGDGHIHTYVHHENDPHSRPRTNALSNNTVTYSCDSLYHFVILCI